MEKEGDRWSHKILSGTIEIPGHTEYVRGIRGGRNRETRSVNSGKDMKAAFQLVQKGEMVTTARRNVIST